MLASGDFELAERVKELAIFDRCRCGDNFCASFDTVPERTTPYPKGFRVLILRPGGLHLDVLDNTIVHVEVLFRDDLKARIHAAVP